MKANYAVLTGLGLEIVGLILAGMWLGEALDNHMDWDGYGQMGGILIALVIWISHIVIVLNKVNRTEDETNR